jgi:pimeloyl-ACP methyl ester carboxylesterase
VAGKNGSNPACQGRGPQLAEIAKALVARGYSALAWDMPGHGDRASRTNLPELAAATAAIARQAGPLAGVVAHSFGLATTLVATRDGLAPPRLVGVAGSALLLRIADQFGDLTGFTPRVVERMRANLSARLGFSWDELEAATLAPSSRWRRVSWSSPSTTGWRRKRASPALSTMSWPG